MSKRFLAQFLSKGWHDRDYYLFVILDVISCRYRVESWWFIALSSASSSPAAGACRMNTRLSVPSIRLLTPFTLTTLPHFMPEYINNISLLLTIFPMPFHKRKLDFFINILFSLLPLLFFSSVPRFLLRTSRTGKKPHACDIFFILL